MFNQPLEDAAGFQHELTDEGRRLYMVDYLMLGPDDAEAAIISA